MEVEQGELDCLALTATYSASQSLSLHCAVVPCADRLGSAQGPTSCTTVPRLRSPLPAAAAQPPGQEAVYVVLDLQDGVEALPEPGARLQLEVRRRLLGMPPAWLCPLLQPPAAACWAALLLLSQRDLVPCHAAAE